MLRLRKILLCNYIYYLFLLISVSYFIVFAYFPPHNSRYKNISSVTGTIIDISKVDNNYTFIIKTTEKILCNYEGEFNYNLGDIIKLSGQENIIYNNTIPNTFNYKKYLYYKRIYHVISVEKIQLIKKNINIFYNIKIFLYNKSKNLKSYGYIQTFLFGNKYLIQKDVFETYRTNGFSHLFAISGLHISLFTSIILFLLIKIKVPENKRYICLILFLLVFMYLTNFSSSVVRASIFTILCLIDKIFYFYIKKVNLLLLTLSIVIFINPFIILDLGFIYSYSITLGILMFGHNIKTTNYFLQLIYISILSFCISFPITINNFFQINFLSILYNLLFVPFISFVILPLSLLTYLIPFLDKICYFFIIILENISLFLSKIRCCTFIFSKLNIISVIIYYLILYFVLRTKNKYFYLFLILLMFFIYLKPIFFNNNYLMMLDVGQGDSLILKYNRKVILIDTGGKMLYNNQPYTYSIAKNKIMPYLKSQGINKIDTMILTHGDADHMMEAKYLVENFKVGNIIFNVGDYNYLELELIDNLKKYKIPYYNNIEMLNIENKKLFFLNTKKYSNENDNSSVIYTEIEGVKILLMGDAGTKREKDIIEKYNLDNIDFLKIGHHGSSTSSSSNFINSIKPKNCLISVGKNNKFGHPKDSVLDILNNCNIYRTDINGSIKITLKKEGYKINTYDYSLK